MRTPPKLSSQLTFLCEWFIPASYLVYGIQNSSYALSIFGALALVKWIVVMVWGVGFILISIYAWPIKQVAIEGDYFVISNFFVIRRAPISHLARVSESQLLSHGATIILHFEPPTPFGKRVRLITPFGSSDDEIAAYLRSLIDSRD